ncbi:uncharacterized protein LOC110465983 [Mizuhopecten yessoensis]|uniref:Uncharacterized protein n=1 Tax=Mizuhopecten yessoensis TaxID=6573 RepID=A0A210PQG9_MIZYE|nr:uncharacterized protein LOC110465983 [Mizuhopecten yessoensis]OWF38704.1 hypothetical protein KP79_PYT23182 [Mizuhopecten yessoensis]
MATTETKQQNEIFDEALGFIRKYPMKLFEEVERTVQGLDISLVNLKKDSKTAYSALPETVSLARVFGLPNISAKIAESLLVVFRHVGKTYSATEASAHQSSIPNDIRETATGVLSKLQESVRTLVTLSEINPDPKTISTACSEVPLTGNGSEVFIELKSAIKRLIEQEDTGACEATEVRFKGIVDCHDLYYTLDSLWEFVLHYIVILCIAQGKSQSTAEGYFEVIEGQRLDRESQSKILFKPEAEFAGVAAVFSNGNWPMLKKYTERSLSFQLEYFKSLNGRKVKLVSCGNTNETFAMFRHPPEKTLPFTQKRYVRVSKENHTIFYLDLIEETYFVIRLDAHRVLTLKVNRKGYLVTEKPGKYDKTAEKGQFNLVRLKKDIVMISCRHYPTCFVTMKCAEEDACLETKNIGAGNNSQWKLTVLD